MTVHVTSDAKASPSITPLTTMSADLNMPIGDKSLGRADGLTSAAFVAVGAAVGATAAIVEAGLEA